LNSEIRKVVFNKSKFLTKLIRIIVYAATSESPD